MHITSAANIFSIYTNSTEIDSNGAIFLKKLEEWEKSSNDEERQERSEVAARLRKAYRDKKTFLDLSNFTRITSLPEILPETVEELFLNGCTSLEALPEILSDKIDRLWVMKCPSLTVFPRKYSRHLHIIGQCHPRLSP